MALQTKTFQTGDYAYGSWSNGYVLSLTLTEESVDSGTNSSWVAYTLTLSNTDNNRFYSGSYSWDISIGGSSIAIRNFSFDLSSNFTAQTVASGTLRISHGPDGTWSMPFAVSVPNVQAYNRYGPPELTLTGTWKLTAVAADMAVSCRGGIIGQAVPVTVRSANPSLMYTLSYRFGALEGEIIDKTPLTELDWLLPEEFYTQLPDSMSGTGTLTCTAYSGHGAVGSASCSFTARIDKDICKPTLWPEVTDINSATLALTGDAGRLVRYCSTAYADPNAQAGPGAQLTACTLTHNGASYDGLPVSIANVEQAAFRFRATDSRGLTYAETATAVLVPYIRLSCNLSDNKPDGNGNMTVKVTGNYYNGSFGAASNTLAVHYRYKARGGAYGPWTAITATPGARTYTAQAELTGLDYRTVYTFQARATDCLATVLSAEYVVRAAPVFDWDENDFNINGLLRINETAVGDFVVSRGKTDIWHWEKWNSGLAKCWAVTGNKTFTFEGAGNVYYGTKAFDYVYPFDWDSPEHISVNIISSGPYLVPVIHSISGGVLRVSYARFYGGLESEQGYYCFSAIGKWK